MKNVKIIELKNEEVKLKLTVRAQSALQQKYKKSITEMLNDIQDVEVFVDIIFQCGLKFDEFKKRDEVYDFIDDLVDEEILKNIADKYILIAELFQTAGLIDEKTLNEMKENIKAAEVDDQND